MSKTDIRKTTLYITELSDVIESTNRIHPKPLFVDGRHSDAFVYIMEGGCTYTFDDGDRFSVGVGDVLYLAGGAVYRMDVDEGDYHYIYCDFKFQSSDARKSAVYSPKSTSDTENLFRRLHRTHTASGTLAECLSLLYRIYGAVIQTSDSTYVGQTARQRITVVRDFIDRNCHDCALTVSALALQAGMSEVHLRKLFHSLYGVSPLQYIISARIGRAKQLMQYPFLSLEECATQSGFSSLAYFSRVFRDTVGMTPSAYRRTIPKKEV